MSIAEAPIRLRLRCLVAALTVVAVLLGAAVHSHRAIAASADTCTACALHETTSAGPELPTCAAPPAVVPAPALPAFEVPLLSAESPLSVAPKTSPPAR